MLDTEAVAERRPAMIPMETGSAIAEAYIGQKDHGRDLIKRSAISRAPGLRVQISKECSEPGRKHARNCGSCRRRGQMILAQSSINLNPDIEGLRRWQSPEFPCVPGRIYSS